MKGLKYNLDCEVVCCGMETVASTSVYGFSHNLMTLPAASRLWKLLSILSHAGDGRLKEARGGERSAV
jgi:hypothetical protein